MSKIEFNYGALSNSALVHLNNAIDSLNQAIRRSNNYTVPRRFDYRSYLNNLSSKTSKNKDAVSEAREWIIRSNKNYSNCEDDCLNSFTGLSKTSIKNRSSIIR